MKSLGVAINTGTCWFFGGLTFNAPLEKLIPMSILWVLAYLGIHYLLGHITWMKE